MYVQEYKGEREKFFVVVLVIFLYIYYKGYIKLDIIYICYQSDCKFKEILEFIEILKKIYQLLGDV